MQIIETILMLVMVLILLICICHWSFAQEPNGNVVKLIYFLPNDRVAQEGIDKRIDTMIKDAQQFVADQMFHHGFGRRTFRFETDTSGNAVVHHIDAKFAEEHYHYIGMFTIEDEIKEHFNLPANISFQASVEPSQNIALPENIFFIVAEGSTEVLGYACGVGRQSWLTREINGNEIGTIFIPGNAIIVTTDRCFIPSVASHELGHVFGLQHDFRDDSYIMSYGDGSRPQLSKCAAKWLNVSRFLNSGKTLSTLTPAHQMLPPLTYPSNAIGIRFDLTDSDLLYQAQLIIPATAKDPSPGVKLYDCKSLNSESSQIEFFMPDSTIVIGKQIELQVIDLMGNITRGTGSIEMDDVLPLQPDVNTDGTVDILDLILVASLFEQTNVHRDISNVDVNRDGVINVNDLILVANAIKK